MFKTYPFKELIIDDSAGNPKISRREYLSQGSLPVVDQGQQEIGGYTNNLSLKNKTVLPCLLFGDHTKI
jgi:type I restriction enzyme S subunit